MILRALRFALSLGAAVTLLAACGLPPSPNPSLSLQRTLESARPGSSSDLLYTGAKHYVDVYTFPSGSRIATFSIKGSINGMCSDSKGNVFIAAAPPPASKSKHGFVYEYAPGGKAPVGTLDLPTNEIPMACSSDPTTGNLAVTAQNAHDYAPGIAIYAGASGTPKFYQVDELGANPQAGYDGTGDLLATSGGDVAAELPKGQTAFVKVTLAQTLGGVDHVQWDGAYWALQSFDVSKHNGEKLFERIYRVKVIGSRGKIAQAVRFDDWPEKNSGQSWIESGAIVATPFSHIVFWTYPAGGKPDKIIHSTTGAKAITVSAGG
jgi:hypothetical protein